MLFAALAGGSYAFLPECLLQFGFLLAFCALFGAVWVVVPVAIDLGLGAHDFIDAGRRPWFVKQGQEGCGLVKGSAPQVVCCFPWDFDVLERGYSPGYELFPVRRGVKVSHIYRGHCGRSFEEAYALLGFLYGDAAGSYSREVLHDRGPVCWAPFRAAFRLLFAGLRVFFFVCLLFNRS